MYTAAYYQGVPPTSTVVVNPTVVAGATSMFPATPMQITCPNCHQSIVTQCTYEMGLLVWIIVIALCVVG